MTIFTNRFELHEHMNRSKEIIEAMGQDLLRIANMVDKTITIEDIMDSYCHVASSPSILESIEIDQGTLTIEEAKRNYLMESVFRELNR